MAAAMHSGSPTEPSPDEVERRLREELARADRSIASAPPVLRHLLGNDEPALVSDETVARIRAMVRDVARQLLDAHAEAAGAADPPGFVAERLPGLAARLMDQQAVLAHIHALALEGQLLERLRLAAGLDPVRTRAIEHAAGGEDANAAALAMAVLAAQARFVQHHHRMELALRDLPGELFHAVLTLLRSGPNDDEATAGADQRLRSGYDESAARPALLARFGLTLDRGGYATLAIERAGLSLLSSALALAVQEAREAAILAAAFAPSRLAVMLRAAGLAPHGVEAQMATLHPGAYLPEGFATLSVERAAALLRTPQAEAAF